MTGPEPQCAPAATRNLAPILAVLRRIVPDSGSALEIASGTGQHIAAFAAAFPGVDWQPSDPSPAARDSIAAWAAQSGRTNLRAPMDLDVRAAAWESAFAGAFDTVLCINLIHIAPWAACEGLMRGAGALLRPGGLLYLYGPFRREGRHTAPSNADFDRSLRARDAAWGVRDMEAVAERAGAAGLSLEETVAMPANNFSLVFRRGA